MSGIKVLLQKVEGNAGNAHHNCHLLDGVDGAGGLLGPPHFGFVQVGLDGILLCWRETEIEFIDPSGDRALGQRAWEMSGQPGEGVSWNGEETLWFKCMAPCRGHSDGRHRSGWTGRRR